MNEEDVLKVAVQEARRVLACDRVVVYSVDRQSQGVVIAESVAPGYPKAFGITIADPCFEARYIEKYENGRVRALNNIYEAGMTQCYIEQCCLTKDCCRAKDEVATFRRDGRHLSEFINLINEVVAQANRQAINATIKSGRNGDAFQQSVVYVAEAVRSLTQQLTKAATEVEPLVAELESQTEDMSAILDRHSVEVATEIELTKETRQTLNQLATMSAKIGNLVNSIAATATDQAQTSTTASQWE